VGKNADVALAEIECLRGIHLPHCQKCNEHDCRRSAMRVLGADTSASVDTQNRQLIDTSKPAIN
jgi:hypothetical protein